MDRILTKAMVVVLCVLLVGLVLNQVFGDHSVGPRTDAEKRAAIESSVDGERGAYEAELVVYATTELQEIFSASRAEQSVSLDDTLLYLTYLLDGSLQEPAQVDFCQRVLPAIRQSFSVLDQQAFGEDLSERQQNLLARINGGYEQAQEEFQNDPACQPPPTASPAQQVST